VMSSTGEPQYRASDPEVVASLSLPSPTTEQEYVDRHIAGLRLYGSPTYADEARWRSDAEVAAARSFRPNSPARQFQAMVSAPSRVGALSELRVPTLVMHGAHDTLIPPAAGERTAQLIPGARIVLLDELGHDYPPQLWSQWCDLVAAHVLSAESARVGGGDDDDKSWLRVPLTDPVAVAERYDEWAATYDDELRGWGYDAPTQAAQLLVGIPAHQQSPAGSVLDGAVLDIGCGTGLTGVALHTLGVSVIDGLDLSEASLAVAEARGVYRTLQRHDFNESPLPFADGSYTAAQCVGVMSYAHDPRSLILDACRVVRPGGTVVFTQRSDLWAEHNVAGILNDLRADGTLAEVTWSEPQPYMPGNADFTDQILVFYATLTVA
jgi:SAM-dependent methyltransferase